MEADEICETKGLTLMFLKGGAVAIITYLFIRGAENVMTLCNNCLTCADMIMKHNM